MLDVSFFNGRKVLVTGHTGFKGTWLCKILVEAGASVIGFSLTPPTEPNLFGLSGVESQMVSVIGDIRHFDELLSVFQKYQPECVMHLAAQPIVRESYKNPRYTYETNVIGTVNVLECVRLCDSVRSVLNVTTDKVYQNDDIPDHPFREEEPLDGYDPYSNSKSCSELVTHSYKKSFFGDGRCAISTARAGNVLGGGDFASERIIPDCVRAVQHGKAIAVRNPYSTRPYQHVLEPLFVYLEIIEKQYRDRSYEGYYNIGPDRCDCVDTGKLVTMFCNEWGGGAEWINAADGGPHEARFLMLDNSKIKQVLHWMPRWHIEETVRKTVEWTRVYFSEKSRIPEEMAREIQAYMGEMR